MSNPAPFHPATDAAFRQGFPDAAFFTTRSPLGAAITATSHAKTAALDNNAQAIGLLVRTGRLLQRHPNDPQILQTFRAAVASFEQAAGVTETLS